MELSEWVSRYEEKAEPYNEESIYKLHFDQDQGFIRWAKVGDVLLMGACCAESMRWVHDWCMAKAKELGCKTLATHTKRNPRAFLRRAYALGYDVHFDLQRAGYMKNGIFYWYLTEDVR